MMIIHVGDYMALTMPILSIGRKKIFPRMNRLQELQERAVRLERYLATQHAITQIIAQSSRLRTSLPRILQAICETADWDFGEVWYVNRFDNHLYCEATWCNPVVQLPRFENSGQSITFIQGIGLPGRAWASGKPAWVMNVVRDKNFLRTLVAEQDGLRSGIAIPIRADGVVIGALTFFSVQSRQVDHELLQVLDTAGSQIGLFIEHKRSEQTQWEQVRMLAVLEERQRLARDLHDSVTQTLFSASVVAEMLPIMWSRAPDQIKPGLDELNQLTRDALTEMRSLLGDLRPAELASGDLPNLLNKLGDTLRQRTKADVTVEIQLPLALSAELRMTLYRITQEALNNIAKHAAATQVSVRLHADETWVKLQIEDNGRGFDMLNTPKGHYGVDIMRERAEAVGAIFQINSVPDKGTRLNIHTRLATYLA
jgi:signal transduction histidine kinase